MGMRHQVLDSNIFYQNLYQEKACGEKLRKFADLIRYGEVGRISPARSIRVGVEKACKTWSLLLEM